ncbi:SgcJ/EcaC family oxidoreductase [Streptomyces sp. HMX87]|uniref:SgcJ/EcaC family oxidoreductase n=1 Tax=Streptomyces sp. HMX87 TaxID=3390849 RepID=UPI003A845C39
MNTASSDNTANAADTGHTRSADLEAIEEVVATVERTQRAKDAEGFLSLFHPDALWTTAHGKVLIGFDAIAEFTRAVLPGASWDGEVTYEVAHVQFLRPDVAAVKVRQVYHSAENGSEGAPLYVMSRQDDGRWLLHACQNTEVRAG